MSLRRANGSAIRAIREAVGIKHGDLARTAGISAGYLSNIEAGRKQPAPDVMRALADRLGVPLDAITYVIPEARETVREPVGAGR
ncbi:helix-turn-helix domain-containing protein [Blastococcus sp. SYSU D00813]